MAKRKLKRQLNLLQVIMLGTAGTIAAEIFVLTGHVAQIAGPETVLALVLAGLMTLSIALNYCELATTFPVTGGAMTYVGEAFGKGWLMFLVGSLDCLSSTFYAALSAVGFAISLAIFIPGLPIIPIAILVIIFVGFMHLRGVSNVGNFQILLGAFLLAVFAAFVFKGFTSVGGFQMETFLSGRSVFQNQSTIGHIGRMLSAIALTYNAYVGFEVIADDAEEIMKPKCQHGRNWDGPVHATCWIGNCPDGCRSAILAHHRYTDHGSSWHCSNPDFSKFGYALRHTGGFFPQPRPCLATYLFASQSLANALDGYSDGSGGERSGCSGRFGRLP